MDAIPSAVPPEFVQSLGVKASTKVVWEALKATRIDSDRAKKAKVQQLRREYKALAFHDDEVAEDYALHLQSIVSQLGAHGVTIIDEEQSRSFCASCHPNTTRSGSRLRR